MVRGYCGFGGRHGCNYSSGGYERIYNKGCCAGSQAETIFKGMAFLIAIVVCIIIDSFSGTCDLPSQPGKVILPA